MTQQILNAQLELIRGVTVSLEAAVILHRC